LRRPARLRRRRIQKAQIGEDRVKIAAAVIDVLAERIQLLGGVSIAMARDVAERRLSRDLPKVERTSPTQISRLMHAHEIMLK